MPFYSSEADRLRQENAQLRAELTHLQKDNRILKIQLKSVRENREILELRIAELLGDEKGQKLGNNYEFNGNGRPPSFPETPILSPAWSNGSDRVPEPPARNSVRFNEEVTKISIPPFYEESTMLPVENELEKEGVEPERYELSGTTDTSDFTSSRAKLISISKSHPGYVTLKNNSSRKSQCLDDFIFVRTVDGKSTVPPTPLPLGIVIPPNGEFTIYANHPEARCFPGKSCILERFPTFGAGKVSEDRLLDEIGVETANYVLCHFR